MKFERIVQAALSETRSKFALAEALALEIPPQKRGPRNDASVPTMLEEARKAIVKAGGEPRDTKTLGDYRLTGLWVYTEIGRNFRWLPDVSFSAHLEARSIGLSVEGFNLLPPAERTVPKLRVRGGRNPVSNPAGRMQEWTPAQRVEAVREAVKDPDIARAVIADRETNVHLAKARQGHDQEVQNSADLRHPDRIPLRHESEHATDMYRLTQIRRELFQIAEKTVDRRLSKTQREEGQDIAEEVAIAASRVKVAFSGTIDQELADAIDQWRNE